MSDHAVALREEIQRELRGFGSLFAPATSGAAQSDPVIGPIAATSPKYFGAAGDGITDDSAAFAKAWARAQAFSPPLPVLIPPGVYRIAQNNPDLSFVDGMRVLGVGTARIIFTGTGTLFGLTGAQRCEIAYLEIFGALVAGAHAIAHHFTAVGALSNHYHHLLIEQFGDGTSGTGGGMSIDSDSQGLELGPHLFMSNKNYNVRITANTDSLYMHDNVLGSWQNAPCRALDASGGNGSGGMVVARNNIVCEGLGTIRINGGGEWALIDNDVETQLAFTNASNASFELLNGSFYCERNAINIHLQNQFCIYFADGAGVTVQRETGTYNAYTNKAVRINASPGNVYGPSVGSAGESSLYTADYPSIVLAQGSGGGSTGFFQGFATAPLSGFGRNGACQDGPHNVMTGETGANNAIASSTGVTVALTTGLRVTVPLNHSLQAGANTFAYNGGAALAIKSSRNPANNIATAYAVGGWITLLYDGIRWLDVTQ